MQVQPDLYFELKKRAAEQRRKLYEVLNEALRDYLDKGGSRETPDREK